MMTYIMKRTQIYIEDDQDTRLERRAQVEGRTKSALIRDAIDQYLARRSRKADVRIALDRTFGAVPGLEVPSRDEWERGGA